MKRVIALSSFIFIFIIWLVWSKNKERYTDSEFAQVFAPFTTQQSTIDERLFIHYITNTVFSELNDDRVSELSNINSLVDVINTGRSTVFAHYSNIDELNSMYDKAYDSTETSLSARDRMILRAITFTASIKPPFPVTYTSDGVPDWTSAIITETGKTTKEMLLYCFTLLVKLHDTNATSIQTAYTPEFYDYLNSTIPDKYSPKFERTNQSSFIDAMQAPNPDEKSKWVWKALSIGPVYIAWLAENKWRFDLTWNP